MPELPDLEVIAEFLNLRFAGAKIVEASVLKPIVVRNLTGDDFAASLEGQRIASVSRRGKFLLFRLGSGDWLVINPMRSGRFRCAKPDNRPGGTPFVVLRFADGTRLHYTDPNTMGKVYLTPALELVPTFAALGPEALAPELTLMAFAERLRRRRGEIKGVLTNQTFVAGIGNAYADEMLYRAGVYPFRKSPSLSEDEVRRIYQAMHAVLEEAVSILRERVGADIHVEIRDFLQVHGRGGQPCPRCGAPISRITARRRLTNFCRTCQPGTMLGNLHHE
jgi:formamidopyrimidine-DNA glycosylase